MSPEKRTVEQWVHHLTGPGAALTLSELMALMLVHIRDNVIVSREAAEHTEGMLGAIDDLLGRWTAMQGIPYAGSVTVRAALDEQRDTRRKLAEQARSEPKP